MLTAQFLGLNVHFAVNLFAALVCFAVFGLVFDAWLGRRNLPQLLVWLGFIALTLGFLLTAATLTSTQTLSQLVGWAAAGAKLAGLLAISLGQLLDPLQRKPQVASDQAIADLVAKPAMAAKLAKPASKRRSRPAKRPAAPAIFSLSSAAGLPAVAGLTTLGALGVSVLYWRRATTGLERHLLPVAHAFAWLAMAELAHTVTIAGQTANPLISQWLAEFGPVWWSGQALQLAGSIVLGRWVWNYLTKRLLSQLFMTLIGQAMAIFLVSTVGFSYLMLSDLRAAQLGDLSTAGRVLQYAITSRQNETIAQAGAAAAGSSMSAAVGSRNRAAISSILAAYYTDHQLSSLTVTDVAGVVLWRAHDPDRAGDSRSGDPLVRRALVGQAASDVVVASGVTAPTVALVAASPVRDATGQVVGSVTLGRVIGDAFVDGIQQSTGLASTVYGGHVRAATTLTSANGRRDLGIAETNAAVTTTVLEHGHTYTGTVVMQNRPYLTAILPLADINNRPVGMLQAARPASDLYAAANRSLQLTFVAAVTLIILAAYPLYRLASFVERQLR